MYVHAIEFNYNNNYYYSIAIGACGAILLDDVSATYKQRARLYIALIERGAILLDDLST